jgi:hypothetical protein
LQVGLGLGEGDEFCGVLARQPEARHIERDADELRFRLAAGGRLRFDKHNRACAQPRGVQPVVARVEVHQHDAAFHRLAAKPLELPVAHIDQVAPYAVGGQLRSAHLVGPEGVDAQFLPVQVQVRLFVDGDGDGERFAAHILQSEGAELLLDIVGGAVGARVACHARTLRRHPAHGLRQPRIRDRAHQLAVARLHFFDIHLLLPEREGAHAQQHTKPNPAAHHRRDRFDAAWQVPAEGAHIVECGSAASARLKLISAYA